MKNDPATEPDSKNPEDAVNGTTEICSGDDRGSKEITTSEQKEISSSHGSHNRSSDSKEVKRDFAIDEATITDAAIKAEEYKTRNIPFEAGADPPLEKIANNPAPPNVPVEHDDDDITSSVQLMPDRAQTREPRPPRIGAYAIQTPRYIDDNRRPTIVAGNDIETGAPSSAAAAASAAFSTGDDSDLVQAELVDSEVVVAEKLNENATATAEAPSVRSKLLLIGSCLMIVILIATVAALLIGKDDDGASSNAPWQTGSSTNDSSLQWSEPKPDEEPCFPFASFESAKELYAAVSAFYEDPSSASNVSQKYGWPIGAWCVSQVGDFSHILDPERDEYGLEVNLSEEALLVAYNFHKDIGDWDLSESADMTHILDSVQNLSAILGIDRWDTSRMKDMAGAFKDTQWVEPMLDLSSWDIGNVWGVASIFKGSNVSIPGIAGWNTESLAQMFGFAEGAVNFNEDIGNWNTHRVFTLQRAFRDAESFNQDLGRWNTSSLKKLNMAFWEAKSFNQDLSNWDVSGVGTMHDTFHGSSFNQDISSWDVSEVTTMRNIFRRTPFNQDISSWDVSKVTALTSAFEGAEGFNQNLCAWGALLPQNADIRDMFVGTACPNRNDPVIPGGPFCFECAKPCLQTNRQLQNAVTDYYKDSNGTAFVSRYYGSQLGSWCVSKLDDFTNIFRMDQEARNFTIEASPSAEYIGDWDTSKARLLNECFSGVQNLSASWGLDKWKTSSLKNLRGAFRETRWVEPMLSLSSWDVSGVRAMAQMIRGSNVERAGIANWDTRSVRTLYNFASRASNFNEDISNWNVERVTDMHYAFDKAVAFNQNLDSWNVTSAKAMNGLFRGARSFNQPLGSWDVSRVGNLAHAFKDSAFNQDISSWNLSSVKTVAHLFEGAASFNQNLCAWGFRLPQDANTTGMFGGTDCPNKTDPLIPGGPFCFNCN